MAQPMAAKFGISLSNRAILFGWATIDDLLDAAVTAEQSDYFHSVWVGDNLLSKARVDAMIALSAIAARTQQVKLGTICMASFPMRHPIQVAIQWASLDVLSHGRTILAVCNGAAASDGPQFKHELEVFGMPSKERVGRLVEGVNVIRRLWSEDQVTHDGEYYQFADVNLMPKPDQQPLPIYIAANPKEGADPVIEDRVLRRVAALGDGWQTDATPADTFHRRFDTIKNYAAEQGRDPSELESCLHLMVNINEDRDEGFEEARGFLMRYYGAGAVSRERTELWLAYGSPQQVIEKIQSYIDAGCTMPVLRFVAHDLKGQLRRCIEEVMPAFRA